MVFNAMEEGKQADYWNIAQKSGQTRAQAVGEHVDHNLGAILDILWNARPHGLLAHFAHRQVGHSSRSIEPKNGLDLGLGEAVVPLTLWTSFPGLQVGDDPRGQKTHEADGHHGYRGSEERYEGTGHINEIEKRVGELT